MKGMIKVKENKLYHKDQLAVNVSSFIK